MASLAKTGRPKAMQSKPVFMDPVFDDGDAAMAAIREAAPYPTLPAHYGVVGESEWDAHAFFRASLTGELFLHNPNWIAAAKASFGAQVVEPVRCLVNLAAQMEEMGAHIDLPTFRGFVPTGETRELLMAMIHSALFYDWMEQFASGLAWFYRGAGGEFLYWPQGVEAPPGIVRPPFWNKGLMSDNEAMFHAVAPVGTAEDRARIAGQVQRHHQLHPAGAGGWEVRDGDDAFLPLAPADLRISLLWKARVWRDEEHRAACAEGAHGLTPELIAEVFLRDLAARGIAHEEPSDPLGADWQAFLAKAYPEPFQGRAVDYL